MIQLNKSNVRYYDDPHIYELNGHTLKGVTPIIDWMFPETYASIPEDIMQRAAAYGGKIHKYCELYDNSGTIDEHPSIKDYIRLCKENYLQHECSEYLVDDGKNIASRIDKVFTDMRNNEVVLGDIKTTSRLHDERVRLQLSIYAVLFELNNPTLKVSRICAIWLPNPEKHYGEPCIKYLERIPFDVVYDMLNAYLNGESNERFRRLFNIPVVADDTLPAQLADVEMAIVDLEEKIKTMTEQQKELKAGLLKLMQENNVKKWTGEHITLTRKEGGTRITLDSAKVKKMYPDVFAECCKESVISESLMVKIN